MTSHNNRCVFVGLAHVEEEEMSATVVCVIIQTHTCKMTLNAVEVLVVCYCMGTEGFRSLAIFMSALHSVTVYLRCLPPDMEAELRFSPLSPSTPSDFIIFFNHPLWNAN